MTVKDRTYEFIRYKGLKVSQFETMCGLSNGYVSSMRKGFGDDKLNNVLKMFPELRREWILFGEGMMLQTADEPVHESGKVIRYWSDLAATGGGLESFNDISSDFVPLVIPDFRDCTDAVNVIGESMSPTYKNGSIIVIKEWTESFIEYGNAYLIITRNGNRMVKYIRPAKDEQHVICASENPDFAPFEVSKEDILRLYVVKGVISKIAM